MNKQGVEVPRGTRALKVAHVMIVDDTHTPVWEGSIRKFFADNRMDRDEQRKLISDLRPVNGMPSEPVSIGGGAGVEFSVLLVADYVRPRRCTCGQWPIICGGNNFDYELQAWVHGNRVVGCGHSDPNTCGCNAARFAGMLLPNALDVLRAESALRYMEAVTGIDQKGTDRLVRALRGLP